MFYMDAEKFVDFGTIKTVYADVKAAFCVFFFFQGLVPLYNKYYYKQVFFWNVNVLLSKQGYII